MLHYTATQQAQQLLLENTNNDKNISVYIELYQRIQTEKLLYTLSFYKSQFLKDVHGKSSSPFLFFYQQFFNKHR